MGSLRSGLAGILALMLGIGAASAVTAQGTLDASFPARIIAGSCDELGGEAAFQLADLTYGLAEEGAAAGSDTGMTTMGAPETVLVATGVTRIGVTAAELTDPAHVVAVFAPGTEDAVACGAIGGIAPEENLFFGLQEENGSGYTGIGWLNSMDDGVLLTLLLTSPEAVVGETAMATPMATPGAMATPMGSPMAAAEATPMTMATPFPAEATPPPAEASPAVTTGAEGTPATGMAQAATPAMDTSPTATEESAAAASPAAEASPATDASPAAQGAAETVTIESVDIDFIPEEVSIPADTEVTSELPNNGVTLHNFSLDQKNNENLPIDPISVDIAPGATEQVTVNLPPGEYYFYCNVPGHEPAGMFGTLIVG